MTDTTQSPLEGNVLFYNNPEPLDAAQHATLGVNAKAQPYAFVAQTNVVPLTVTEFAAAALSYPVIFVGENRQPVAVMGLNQNDNLFVSPEGVFRPDAYIPAYVRRYPFVFADDKANGRLILCIDRGADIVAEGGENPLFVNGQPSDYTNMAMEFCNNFEQERLRTESFVNLIKELDLLDVREALFTPRDENGNAGEPQKIAEYYAVSEDKLRALSAEKLAELRDNGALGQIYAHLVSLLGWDRLIALAFARNQAAAATVN
nr:SapC family protein [uncultured Brevundimonas sp.]